MARTPRSPTTRPSRPTTRPSPPSPRSRLLALPPVRRLMTACVLLGVLVWALLVAQWTLVAAVVSAVFSGAAAPDAVVGQLAGVVLLWAARAGVVAVRERLARALLRRSPGALADERAGSSWSPRRTA